MGRLRYYTLLALAIFAVAGGCQDSESDDEPGRLVETFPTVLGSATPADAKVRFEELYRLYESSSFDVLYNSQYQVDREAEETRWQKAGPSWRIDTFSAGGSSDDLGVTSLTTEEGPLDYCTWSPNDGGQTFDIHCTRDFGDEPHLELLFRDAQSGVAGVAFDGHRTILGVPAECFLLQSPFSADSPDAGSICLSGDGVPLLVEDLVAEEIGSPPVGSEWLAQVVPASMRDARIVDIESVPLGDLELPDIPLLDQLVPTVD